MASVNSQRPEHNLDECSLYGSWIFSLLGAAIAIPVGIKKKSLAPLVFFGSTGAMLDIVQSFADCERERIEKLRAEELLVKRDPAELSHVDDLTFKDD
ncbi:uncharacterized protein [Physcomitrium patens]|uniref:Uncharacterized protein n=1 Tax=Physcomitrium patens TaxID=3218 RepID=A0A2K1KPL6_PHYPA|nr:uncharacterized protein LOC112281041 [Physcomitrium patens]PNR55710.1 hypothetical protein PHYPA_006607 [Physcomitrium patens]|eukprot:XP_024372957.1 uncharacterized protein LOC112281041 [Physcomitrella patens]